MTAMLRFSTKTPYRRNAFNRLIVVTALIFCVGIKPVDASHRLLLEPWRWVRFTTDDGLPSSRVVKICETTSDRLWVSTTTGIAWYDGYRWIDCDLELETSRKEGYILTPDRDGGVLVVIDEKLYQGDERGLHHVPLQHMSVELKIIGAIPSFDGGLIILGKHPQSFTRYLLHQSVAGTLTEFPLNAELIEGNLFRIWGQSDDVFWLHATKGLYRYKQGTWHLQHAANVPSGNIDHVMTSSGESFVAINHSFLGKGLWSWKEGESPGLILSESRGRIDALAISPSGDALAVYDSGVVHNRHDQVWSELLPIPFELTGVNALLYRRNGDLVVGTERGLFLHRARFPLWDHWKNPDPDSTDRVNAFVRARDGSLWIATSDGIERRHPDGRVDRHIETGGRSLRDSTGIAEDRDGNIWVCSGGSYEGAFRFDGTTWKHFGAAQGLPGLCHRIYPDRQGRLWFVGLGSLDDNTVNTGHGATVYDGTRFERWTVEQGLPNDRVYAFAAGNDGELWFGTKRGLCRFQNGQWTYWNHESGLRNKRIWSIAVDESNTLWFTDQKFGLGRIVDDVPEYLSFADGLPDNEIQEIRADPDGGIWVTCTGSVARYRDGRWNVFTSMDGLGHSNLWPIHVESDHVYVGTVGKGTAILNRRVLENASLKIFLDEPIIGFDTVNLRWKAFSKDQVIAPRHIETRYRLDEQAWESWTVGDRAAFPISPGSHELTLQARSRISDRPFTEERRTIQVPYPFHRHPVVLAFAGTSTLTILGLGLLVLTRQRKSNAILRDSESRFRQLAEASPVMIWMSDPERRCVYFNRSWLEFRGRSLEEELDGGWRDGIHQDDLDRFNTLLDETYQARSDFRTEYRFLNAEGEYRWVTDCGAPRYSLTGEFEGYIGSCFDFTERKLAEDVLKMANDELDHRVSERTAELARVNENLKEEIVERSRAEAELVHKNRHEQLLFSELDHRVRNNLSSLIALLEITRSGNQGLKNFAESVRGRIEVMAAVHTLLSQSHWSSMKLRELIRVLMPAGHASSIELTGDSIDVSPRQATAFGMVIHELFTNSIKHGALSTPTGCLRVDWVIEEKQRETILLNWTWVESEGPMIESTVIPGVGTSIIEGFVKSELRGKSKLSFDAEGVSHQFTITLEMTDVLKIDDSS